ISTHLWVLLSILVMYLYSLAGVTGAGLGLDAGCVSLDDSQLSVMQSEGDVVIGGLFPLHYLATDPQNTYKTHFDLRAFRWMMTMVFAVEEINRHSALLPGVRLGYRILDSCDLVHTSLRGVLSLVTRKGSGVNTERATDGRTPGCLAGAPVSYFATCTCLSNKLSYPSFLRTVPSDYFQVRGLVQLVSHFGWRWVGVVGTPDDYSHYNIHAFTQQLQEQGGCVAFHLTIPDSPSQAVLRAMADTLLSARARVVVAFSTEGQLLEFFCELAGRNVTGIQWVASEAWISASLLTTPQFQPLLEGTLGFALRGAIISGLREFMLKIRPSHTPGSEFINMFWEEVFGCNHLGPDVKDRVLNYTDSEDLGNIMSSYTNASRVRISYNVYKAVYAIANALHQLLQCDSSGQSQTQGKYSTVCVNCPEYYWSDSDRVKCVAGIEDFLSFYDTMGVVLVLLSLVGVVTTTGITAIFHRFRATPIVKANNSELSFLLLLSLKLCFLCSLLFIGRPSEWACGFRQAAFGVSFVLCLSCLLVKTIVVLVAFKDISPGSSNLTKLFGPPQQRLLILCTTAPQVCLCAGWLSMAPPFPFRNSSIQGLTGMVLLECKERWPPGFYLVLGYIGLLASLCLLLAFLGRKLPDTFNEAKLITFSMLIFCAVWISFIPAYVSSPGKFTVAVEIFAILASSFGLLVCIFAPKCYIILLRPDRNNKQCLVGRHKIIHK
uniref:G-protein coupled receptors family 3 profile domain-containing protein n=1 Tax=Esox lucius TaxID=8010 RepID=A0A3P8Y2Q0_ESOLU